MTDEQRESAARMWADGWSVKRIAYEMGVTKNQLKWVLDSHRDQFPPRHRPYTTEEVERIARMWAEGMTCKEIGEAMGRTWYSIRRMAYDHRDLCPSRGYGGSRRGRR